MFVDKTYLKDEYINACLLFQFIQSLSIIDDIPDDDLIQRICAAIDVNSFEVRGPPVPSIGCAEVLRGVYLKAALLAHDCVANTHMAINDNNTLVCHASVDIKKGEPIYYNYTDPLKVRRRTNSVSYFKRCVMVNGVYFTTCYFRVHQYDSRI